MEPGRPPEGTRGQAAWQEVASYRRPSDRIMCKNNTLPQTSFAGGNNMRIKKFNQQNFKEFPNAVVPSTYAYVYGSREIKKHVRSVRSPNLFWRQRELDRVTTLLPILKT